MATLVLTAVGTAIAGPLGGAIGALAGNHIDAAVFGSGGAREGPRIKDLAVTTSSYGQPIARHFGAMRVPGVIIWSTDLIESSETNGGGKGKPKTTSFSYSVSFAVALSSRPIDAVGRVWADGRLLRGSAGDLKSAGLMRVFDGHGDQAPDPLISAAEGGNCPAFRSCAYVVFEDLQLEEFGNRIPALTFEVIADTQPNITLGQILPSTGATTSDDLLAHMLGYSDEGGPILSSLKSIGRLYPLYCTTNRSQVELGQLVLPFGNLPILPAALVSVDRKGSKGASGAVSRRAAAGEPSPVALRYYDRDRDYQPGVQRAIGQRGPGQELTLELPATLSSTGARKISNAKANRQRWSGESITWKMADLDPRFAPGSLVRVPGHAGVWNIASWEWSDLGIELSLERLPPQFTDSSSAEPGRINPLVDQIAVPTILKAFELPWDGAGASSSPSYFAAVSAETNAWPGAALYVEQDGSLAPMDLYARRRSAIGSTISSLAPSNCTEFETCAVVEINLFGDGLGFGTTTIAGLASGTNRLLIADEVIQFLRAEQLGPANWRLSGLLRGRGGTEHTASNGHAAGATAVLLDDTLIALDPSLVAEVGLTSIAAIGLGDEQPAQANLVASGISRQPPHPVHPRLIIQPGGDWLLCWERRARGQWRWFDYVDTPLVEENEAYEVGIGSVDQPIETRITSERNVTLSSAEISLHAEGAPQAPIWVRQLGTFGPSPATMIATLPSNQ